MNKVVRKILTIFGVPGLVLINIGLFSPAQAAKNVPVHSLDCSVEFPCPPQLQRRVDFWIEVFSRWDKNTAILHDANSPWRVYSTIQGVSGCSKKRVKKERKRLKANLTALAKRLKNKQSPKGRIQNQLAQQFDTLTSKAVFKAVKNTRCQTGVKDQYMAALSRFERYRPLVNKVIKETQMPADLLYLPFVESSFRADAYSKVGAAGMWQIMPKTARTLGMELNAVYDERLDPESATRGAMRYFKNAQKSLIPLSKAAKPGITQAEINPFIVTSYNYGVNGMRRAIKKIGPDFPKVLNEYKSAAFQVAVKNFYASFLAARHLARNANAYFKNIKPAPKLNYQTYVLPNATSIDRIKHQFGVKESDLKPINPALTRFAWNNWRLIPAGYRLNLPFRKHRWTAQIDKLNALSPEPQSLNKLVYRVRRGDTACGIANAFKVSCQSLVSANRLGRKAVIRIGQKLDIPGRHTSGKSSVTANAESTHSGRYKVRAGDTACKVAKRHGVSCRELIRVNKLGRKATIVIGQNLRIPGLVDAQKPISANLVSLNYKVKRGDTACEIAQRYTIPCARLRADNDLGRKATIRVGQVLKIGGRSRGISKNVSVSQYTVRRGDTACQIAGRFDVPCSQLLHVNKLGKRGKIRVGQVLKITSEVGSVATQSQPQPEQQGWLDKLDILPEMSLKTFNGGVSLITLPDETIAHYADWMGSRSVSSIRKLNGLSSDSDLGLGKKIKLPITTENTKARFESKRAEFHQVLVEQFKERFTIKRVDTIGVKPSQSLWSVSLARDVPLWLLLKFNPSLGKNIQPGQRLEVPVVVKK